MFTILSAFRAAARRALAQTPTNCDIILCDNAKTDADNNKAFKVSLTTLAAKVAALGPASDILTTPIIADGDAGVTLTSADQTHATPVVTIPDIGDAADTFVMADTTQTLTNKTLTAPKLADLGFIADANGNELLVADTVTTAVNEMKLANAATGTAPSLLAQGGDTNIDQLFGGKGTGRASFADGADRTKIARIGTVGATTGTETVVEFAQTANRTITMPDATDTLVGKATTDTLTNKTITAPIITAPAAGSTGMILTKAARFEETAAGVSHVATIALPAGAVLHSIKIIAEALWGAAAAVMKVGDTADDDGYFIGVDLKATDLLVGEVLETNNDALWGGKEGAYLVAATGQRGPVATNFGMYYGAGTNIIGTVTVTTPTPTTGRTVLCVEYSVPVAVAPVVT